METKQDRKTICQNILNDIVTNFETSAEKNVICEGILLDLVEDIQDKAQLQLLNNIKEKFNWLKNEGKKEKKCDFDYFEIIGSSRSLAMKCEDIFGPIKINDNIPILIESPDKIEEMSIENNLQVKTNKTNNKNLPANMMIMGGMNCEDIFGFKEDRQKKIKIEGEKICKTILNNVISNFETKQDKENISKGILDSLIENFETSENRKSICNEIILESLAKTNFEINAERKLICGGKNLNSIFESETKPSRLSYSGKSHIIFTEKCLEMKKNKNIFEISPEKLDIDDDNDDIELQDNTEGELICQNILDTVIENLDIAEMVCEETLNDLVGNLNLNSDQQTNSKPSGMDIFSRLLGF